MKKLAAFLVLGLVVSFGPAYAGDTFGVPVSNKVIYGQIKLPDGNVASFGAREGTLVSVQDHNKDVIFGFFPLLVDEREPLAKVMSVEITGAARGGQRVEQIEGPPQIGVEWVPIKSSAGAFQVILDEVTLGRFPQPPLDPNRTPPQALERVFGKSASGTCCVTCDGFTVCASEVELSCGGCTARMLTWR